jgi:hypothetical protein
MFDEIVCRAKKQASQHILLSAEDSDDLKEAAGIIESVADTCPNERLANSLTHILDRLQRIIAAGDYRRRNYVGNGKAKPIEYMTQTERAQETHRLENELAEIEKELAGLRAEQNELRGQ